MSGRNNGGNRGLIEAKISGAPSAMVAGLATKARNIATAYAENRLRAKSRDARRWRKARLLWPLFTKGGA